MFWSGRGFLVLFLVTAATQLDFPAQYDELTHLNFSKYISEHPTWHTIATYEGATNYEAKAPFVYIIAAIVDSVTDLSLRTARGLIVLFASFAIVGFYLLTREVSRTDERSSPTSIVALPYFLFLSLTFMTDVPTLGLLFFAVFGFLKNIDTIEPACLVVGMLAATAMLHIRIDAAYVLLGIGLGLVTVPIQGDQQFSAITDIQARFRRFGTGLWIALAVPLLLRLPLVIVWGGLAAPPAQTRPVPVTTSLQLANFAFTLCVMGLYFFPFVFRRRHAASYLVAGVVALALTATTLSDFPNPNVEKFAGAIRSTLLAVSLPREVVVVALSGLCLMGLLATAELCVPRKRDSTTMWILRVTCLVGLLVQAFRGEVMFERHLMPVTGLVFAIAAVEPINRWMRSLWIGTLLVLQFAQIFRHGLFN